MSLFVVKHQHAAETCPAGDPNMAPFLVKHVSAPNVEQNGMTLHGEAVIDGGHTLYLIVDSPDQGSERMPVDQVRLVGGRTGLFQSIRIGGPAIRIPGQPHEAAGCDIHFRRGRQHDAGIEILDLRAVPKRVKRRGSPHYFLADR